MTQPHLSNLRDEVEDLEQLEEDNHLYQAFIPLGRIRLFFTEDRIRKILLKQASTVESYEVDEAVKATTNNGHRVFATLYTIKKPGLITRFVEADHFTDGQLDAKLPLSQLTLEGILPDKSTAQSFFRRQWKFQIPYFQPDQRHRHLDSHTILPFIHEQRLGGGGFADVIKYTLKRSHCGIPGGNNEQLSVICKQVVRGPRADLRKDYENELYILSSLRSLQHPNIIQLITAFTKSDRHNFLFPVAQGDLKEFLQRPLYDRPIGFPTKTSIFDELWKLSSAVDAVHNYFCPSSDKRRIGCHYDIKPKNILYLNGKLLLSDFGLARLRFEEEGSRSFFKAGEGFYLAPECETEERFEEGRIGRPSDIWSLGCIISEVLVYLDDGPNAVQAYRLARRAKIGPLVGSYFYIANNEPNPAVRESLNQIESKRANDERFVGAINVVRNTIIVDQWQRLASSYVAIRLYRGVQQRTMGKIMSLMSLIESKQGQTDVELYIEYQRLKIWGEMSGLTSNDPELQADTWLAKLPPHRDLIYARNRLTKFLDEIQIISDDAHHAIQMQYPQYKLLQAILDDIWGILSVEAQSKMKHQLEEVLLNTGSIVYEDIALRDIQTQLNDLPMDEKLRSWVPTRFSRIGLLAVLKRIASELCERRIVDGSLLIEKSELKFPFMQLHFHYLTKIQKSEKRVLVETMEYQDDWLSHVKELLERIQAIVSLRQNPLIKDTFPVLKCLGFYHEPIKRELGIVYELPSSLQAVEPTSLYTMMRKSRHREKQPSLTQKFALSSWLASHVLDFHKAGWLHKSICAYNIICSPDTFQVAPDTFEKLFIVGFSNSRLNDHLAFTVGPEQKLKEYQHPGYLQSNLAIPNPRFQQEFEYYSVGLVLTEIGLWKPLASITESIQGSPEEVRESLIANQIPMLRSYMGNLFASAVETCLTSDFGTNTTAEAVREAFRDHVVGRLSRCVV